MAITEFTIDGNDYYRITRTWDHTKIEMQRYVKIGNTEKKAKDAYQAAQKIDQQLSQAQQAYHHQQKINGAIYFRANGQIVGISRLYSKTGKTNPEYEHIFKIRYNPNNGLPIRFTSINIDANGLLTAYQRAIDTYCDFAKIDPQSELKKLLLKSLKYYQFDPSLIENFRKTDPLPNLAERPKLDFSQNTDTRQRIDTTNNTPNNTSSNFEVELKKDINDFLSTPDRISNY